MVDLDKPMKNKLIHMLKDQMSKVLTKIDESEGSEDGSDGRPTMR